MRYVPFRAINACFTVIVTFTQRHRAYGTPNNNSAVSKQYLSMILGLEKGIEGAARAREQQGEADRLKWGRGMEKKGGQWG